MKKLNLLLLSVSFLVSNLITSQNPYASIGKKTKPMLSLSNGKYVEHFENDSIRQIGSVMVNMRTEQIVAFVDSKEQSKKNHSKTSSRFLSVDPLARQFPFYTPYQYAGNTPIQAIDLDGAEPAYAYRGTQNLVIVLQGYNGSDPENNKTQAQNNGEGIDYSGLGGLISLGSEQTQVVVFSSSNVDNTKDDVAKSINGFRSISPNGKVVVVGHSLGAENAIELAKDNKDLTIDLLISVDATDLIFEKSESTIPSNIKTLINYYQTEDKRYIRGSQLTEEDGNKTTYGTNIHVNGADHTELDNKLSETLKQDVYNFTKDKNVVKGANDRKEYPKNDTKNETFNQK